MHSFKELDPQEIRALLDAKDEQGNPLHPDVLTPLAQQEATLFKNATCPRCGAGSAMSVIDVHRPFASDSPLPKKILRCLSCSTEWDPKTGLITLSSLVIGESG